MATRLTGSISPSVVRPEYPDILSEKTAVGVNASCYSIGGYALASLDNLSISSRGSSTSTLMHRMHRVLIKPLPSLRDLCRASKLTDEAGRSRPSSTASLPAQAHRGTVPAFESRSPDASFLLEVGIINDPAQSMPYSYKKISQLAIPMARENPKTHSKFPSPQISKDFSAQGLAPIPNTSSIPRRSSFRKPDAQRNAASRTGDRPAAAPRRVVWWATGKLGALHRGSPKVHFSPDVECHETWSRSDYSRRGEALTCDNITPDIARAIKEEVNSFKREMPVHRSSICNTNYFV